MTRNLGATALTVVVLLAGLAVALRDRLPERPGDAERRGRPLGRSLWQMVEASQDGAVEAYLDLFAGEVREQLETVREEMGDAAFEQYLRQRVADLKGVAVIAEEDLGETVRLEVEYVRAASYDTQSLDLRSSRGRWRIVALGPTQRTRTAGALRHAGRPDRLTAGRKGSDEKVRDPLYLRSFAGSHWRSGSSAVNPRTMSPPSELSAAAPGTSSATR